MLSDPGARRNIVLTKTVMTMTDVPVARSRSRPMRTVSNAKKLLAMAVVEVGQRIVPQAKLVAGSWQTN